MSRNTPPGGDTVSMPRRLPAARSGRGSAAVTSAGSSASGSTSSHCPELVCEAVATLLDQLVQLDDQDAAGVAAFKAELRAAPTDAAVARIIVQAGESARERREQMAREQRQTAAIRAHVTLCLDTLATHLAGATERRQHGLADAETLKAEVLAHVRRLADEVRSAPALTPQRSVEGETLDADAGPLQEVRDREGRQPIEHASRTAIMRVHIGKLERETRNLNVSLHQERHRARLDPLTGIANRASFAERLADELVRWSRLRAPASLLLWDIDRFKAINDSYGHRAGDAVLRVVAKCLARVKRASDYVSRFGGEEFVTLLPDTRRSDALRLAESWRQSVQALKFRVGNARVQVTVSCGITEFIDADTADTVFDRADSALYCAKNSGRNCCIAA
jgi:diguanylate cyclase